ncbi:MAG: aspartate/glutamate racemase family protein [Bacillota bacterium]|nr:aspartate/glutamate racemase family protein [Bacillota bacterium]
MRIKLINPNTTWSMTESCLKAAEGVKRPDTEIIAVSVRTGPSSIECFIDEYLAIPGILEEIIKGDREENVDAYIIACFGDPGLQAAREVTDKPVVGIAQSAMLLSKMISPNFSIVSVLDRAVKVTADLVDAYGMGPFCKSIRTTGLSVLDFSKDFQKGLKALEEQAVKAVKEDKAECILLGCAGFVDFVQELNRKLSVPVIDGVVPAVKFAEALVEMHISTSKNNTWGYPEKKEFTGFEYLDFKFKS